MQPGHNAVRVGAAHVSVSWLFDAVSNQRVPAGGSIDNSIADEYIVYM